MKPLKTAGKTIIILPDWAKEEKYGSIHLPGVRNRDLPNTGLIVGTNPNEAHEFGLGHRVVFDRHKQQLMDVAGEKVAVVKAEDVMAILENS